MKKRTNEEFLTELKKVNPSIIALDTYKDSRTKISCKCLVCNHIWETKPNTLLQGHGCPVCARKTAYTKTRKNNCDFIKELSSVLPSVVPCEEYKNALSYIKCRCRVCGYEWQSKPNWLLSGHGCPRCGHEKGGSSIRLSDQEFKAKLLAVNPHITPLEEYVLSNKPIKCKCQVCGNEWNTTPNRLLQGGGCPKCNRIFQTSFPEQAVFYFIKNEFEDAINGYKLDNSEIDIYIPSKRIGIEYDGKHWHSGSYSETKEKNKYFLLKNSDILLIRIKEEPIISNEAFCDKLFSYVVQHNSYNNLNRTIEDVLSFIGINISVDVESELYAIQEQYYIYKKNHSLALTYPECVEEWYQEKNGNITPYMVSIGSSTKYWWKCRRCGYIWKTSPSSRIKNNFGCSNCYGNAPKTNEQFLAELKLINKDIEPQEEYKGSDVKILCKCKICDHTWMVTPSKLLNKRGCPQCYAKKRMRSQEDFLAEVERINPNVEVLSKYKGINKRIICKCKNVVLNTKQLRNKY